SFPKRHTLLRQSHAEPIRSDGFQRPSNPYRTVTISVGFDHSHDSDFRTDVLFDSLVIVDEILKIDFSPGRPMTAYMLANYRMKRTRRKRFIIHSICILNLCSSEFQDTFDFDKRQNVVGRGSAK